MKVRTINDHGSTTGIGLLTTFAGGMSTPGANTVYGKGPMFVIIGPEHAATLKRDGFTIETIREELFQLARACLAHLRENQDTYISTGHKPDGDCSPSGGRRRTSTSRSPVVRVSTRLSFRRSAARPSPACASTHDRVVRLAGRRRTTSWETAQQILTDAELSDGLPCTADSAAPQRPGGGYRRS